MNVIMNWRKWRINEIEIEIIRNNYALIHYERYGVNQPRYCIQVSYNIFDKWFMRYSSFEEKIKVKLDGLIIKLTEENKRIEELKALENKLNTD